MSFAGTYKFLQTHMKFTNLYKNIYEGSPPEYSFPDHSYFQKRKGPCLSPWTACPADLDQTSFWLAEERPCVLCGGSAVEVVGEWGPEHALKPPLTKIIVVRSTFSRCNHRHERLGTSPCKAPLRWWSGVLLIAPEPNSGKYAVVRCSCMDL